MNGNESVSLPAGEPTLSCQTCGGVMPVLAQAQTRFLGCASCQAFYAFERGKITFLRNWKPVKAKPVVALQQRIRLKGEKYAVVGFLVRKETKEDVYWREYYLFNPTLGYAYLAEYDGHWMLIKPTDKGPQIGKTHQKSFLMEESEFRLYHRYQSEVVQASGEFAYDITKVVTCSEYICPPYIFTRESSKQELRWYRGEYLPPKEVAAALGESAVLPERSGIGSCQPNHLTVSFRETLWMSLVAAVMLLVIQFLLVKNAAEKVVFEQSFAVADTLPLYSTTPMQSKPVVTPSFELEGGIKNLEITLHSPVDNNWFEAEMTLVNERTGSEQDLNVGVEYYHGYSDGEYWTEGSVATKSILPAVPSGTYHLVIVPVKPSDTAHFSISLKRDVTTWTSFWIVLGLLAVVPLIQYFRQRYFEQKRWMSSDYSPYHE